MLNIGLGFRQADDFAAVLPLAPFFQQLDAFETLQHIAFGRDGAGAFQTAMLRHNDYFGENEPAPYALFHGFQPLFAGLRPASAQLQLIAQHGVSTRCADLVKDVKPLGKPILPVRHPRLIHNQENRRS